MSCKVIIGNAFTCEMVGFFVGERYSLVETTEIKDFDESNIADDITVYASKANLTQRDINQLNTIRKYAIACFNEGKVWFEIIDDFAVGDMEACIRVPMYSFRTDAEHSTKLYNEYYKQCFALWERTGIKIRARMEDDYTKFIIYFQYNDKLYPLWQHTAEEEE